MKPTINELVTAISEINTANGWRENKGAILTGESPEAQVASLSRVSGPLAEVVEAVRKPNEKSVPGALETMRNWADYVHHMGTDHPQEWLKYDAKEEGQPLHGSKTQAIARARLIDTETEELTQAILKDDVPNIEEELADIVIRALDFVGAWNEAHPDKPIDLEAAIIAKLEKNKARGYRHGGKTV